MSQKMYFLATDKTGNSDLWVTDGTTTTAVGGLSNVGVAGSVAGGLGPNSLTVFGQQMLFGGSDQLDTGSANGLWLTDGTPGGTTEVGGVSPGTGHSSPFTLGNPNGLSPTGFVTFGSKAIFFGDDSSNFNGLWVTDGTVGGTLELGGLDNGQIVGKGPSLSPENLTAFDNSVLFDAFDSSGFKGLWITDGTTAGTVEIGGSQNQAIFDSGTSSFEANNFITLGNLELFNAPNKEGDAAIWITDGTAAGTVELGGVGNAGLGTTNTDMGDGLANAVRFGSRIFFAATDNDGATGLWVTDGTASGTSEVGGVDDGGLTGSGQHPSSLGLRPTDLTVNGQQVLFNGEDALGFNELWVTDGTVAGTHEIGGEGVGGEVAHEAVNGLNPGSIVSLGNGKAVFIGYDDSNNQNSGKPTLWVTDGTFAGTTEIGGLDNLGVAGVDQNGGFSFTNTLIGGDGLAYFVGANAAGNQVLWETDGTLGGTKIVNATDGNAPATGIVPFNMSLGPVPGIVTNFSGGGQNINLESVPGEEVDLFSTNNVADTVTGSNGTVNLSAAQAALIGGGLLVQFLAGTSNSVTLSNTKGNKDSVFGSKGVVTLSGAQANVIGEDDTVTFSTGTTGNVVYLSDTQGIWDTVNGSNGTVYLSSAQASIYGGGDTVNLWGGTGNVASLLNTANNWDTVNGSNATVYLSSAQASINGGDDTVDFWSGTGNVASLGDTANNWDTVNNSNGSNGTVYLSSAQASIYGGGDTVNLWGGTGNVASLLNTANNWDTVNGSNATVYLTIAQASINGGGDIVNFWSGSGNVASLGDTANNWDTVNNSNGSNGTVYLTSAQASIYGGGDTVNFWSGAGNVASLLNTANNWDTVNNSNGSNGTVYLTSAQASIYGGGDTVNFWKGTGNVASLLNTANKWDTVNGSNATAYLTSAQASINGGGDIVNFWSGSGNVASLGDTANNWDTVNNSNGSNGTVYLTSAQASIYGGGDTVNFWKGTGNVASLLSTANNWDTVNNSNGSNGTVYLTSAQASIYGGGDTVNFWKGTGNVASLLNTANNWDTVNNSNGSNGTVYLTSAQASIYGNGDAIDFWGGATNAVSLFGTDSIEFVHPAFGLDIINGYSSLDSLSFSTADQGHLTISQSNGSTLITRDASDVVTLTGVLPSGLGQISYV